jgi:hypothetical protein
MGHTVRAGLWGLVCVFSVGLAGCAFPEYSGFSEPGPDAGSAAAGGAGGSAGVGASATGGTGLVDSGLDQGIFDDTSAGGGGAGGVSGFGGNTAGDEGGAGGEGGTGGVGGEGGTTGVGGDTEAGVVDDGGDASLDADADVGPDVVGPTACDNLDGGVPDGGCEDANGTETDTQVCVRLGKTCGSVTAWDLCGKCHVIASCGSCTGTGVTCGGGGTPGVCGCTPVTCQSVGKDCGGVPNGCGVTLSCGNCAAPKTCGGGGTPNVCGCIPEDDVAFCTRLGKDCGSVTVNDNCGAPRTVDCGTCVGTNVTCGGNGIPNVCGCPSESNAEFCGRLGKNCGGVFDNDNCGVARTVASCGTCTAPLLCGSSNVCGCTAESDIAFCKRLGVNCDEVTANDNCGSTRTVTSCGTCTAPKTCGAESSNVCGCIAETDSTFCARLNKDCGNVLGNDNCGNSRTADCGTCVAPKTCAGGGTANVCGCTASNCTGLGKNCGSLPDGCGGTLSCGTCTSPQTCGVVTPNVCGCVSENDAAFCSRLGKNCGPVTANDNCGSPRTVSSCGTCSGTGVTCGGGGTANVCGCTPQSDLALCSSVSKNCGTITANDNCGTSRTVPSCGTCTGTGVSCGGGGTANVCGCTAETDLGFCTRLGKNCGNVTANNNCGTNRTVNCGTCSGTGVTCGGGGTVNVCGCTAETDPAFCTRLGKNCGNVTANDNCGGSRTAGCGTCAAPLTCAGATPSVANVCGCTYEGDPGFCSRYGKNCNNYTNVDNCGVSKTVNCGACAAPQTCGGTNVCTCTYEGDAAFCTRLGKNCGNVTAPDNCGASKTVSCGSCVAPQTCGASNVCGCTAESDATFCGRYSKNCGSYTNLDNCLASRTATCGSCTLPQMCGGATPSVANVCGCTYEGNTAFCSRLGKNCGSVSGTDNCGNAQTAINCGTCTLPQTCAGGTPSVANVCGCTYEGDGAFCTRLGKTCGNVTAPDNCGASKTVNCGTCTLPQTCAGGGTANVCGCTYEGNTAFCTRLGKNCGSVSGTDNCGNAQTAINCGTCTLPQTCGGATPSVANVCGCTYEGNTAFCMRLGKTCGNVTAPDNCGASKTVSCGTCTLPQTCGGGTPSVANVCGCTYEGDGAFCTRLGKNCGNVTAPDNCGANKTVGCGTCAAPQTCGGATPSVANVCGCTYEGDATFCSRLGKNCGSVTGTDNCGATKTVASCGTCTLPQTCGGATPSVANVCGCTAESDATFCTRLGKNCGAVTALDNCNTSRTVASCGTCAAPTPVCAANNVCVTGVCNTPYGGTARAITSTIQAEDFDVGSTGTPLGEGCSYHDLSTTNDGNDYRIDEGVDIDVCGDTGGGYRIIYIRTGEWLKYTVTVATAGTYDFTFRVGSDGGIANAFHLEDENAVNLTGNMSVPNTTSGNTFVSIYKTGIALTAGTHVLKLVVDYGPATNDQWSLNWFTAVKQITCATTPYGGTARAITSTIQAEDFDVGNTGLPPGEGCAYHDTSVGTPPNSGGKYRTAEAVDIENTDDATGTYNIGWLGVGEWLKYTVTVAAAGSYDFTFRVSCASNTLNCLNAFHVVNESDSNLTGSVSIPHTGAGQTYTNVVVPSVALTAGTHVLRLIVDSTSTTWNFNYFTAALSCDTPYGGTARALPGTIQAEDYDVGSTGTPPGELCSYHDVSAANEGGQYRTAEGVDIEACTDTGAGYNVGWNGATEWKKYTVNVAANGYYTVNFRVAAPAAVTGAFHLEDYRVTNLTGAMNVPATGSYQTWQTVSKTGVALFGGRNTLKFVSDAGGWNFNWFSVGASTQLEAEAGTNNGGAYEAGGGDSGGKVIFNSGGDSICWSNVNMAGIANARLHYGNGEGSDDTIQLTYPNTGTVIGTFAIANTGGWNSPQLSDANVTFAAQTGTGTLCVVGVLVGGTWVASVDYVVLQ